jgi:hypothetical protein
VYVHIWYTSINSISLWYLKNCCTGCTFKMQLKQYIPWYRNETTSSTAHIMDPYSWLSPWLLGCCCHQLGRSCAGVSRVCSQAQLVFILKHYFTSKLSAAVREAFSNAYPDKEVLNMTTIHQLVTKFWDTRSAYNTTGQTSVLTGGTLCPNTEETLA